MLIILPYPPTVNTYWRRSGRNIHISKRGRKYRQAVIDAIEPLSIEMMTGRLAVAVMAYMPDKRRRDIDNILKSLLDSMNHAGVFEDDEQIDRLLVQRCGIDKPGRVEVLVKPFDATMV